MASAFVIKKDHIVDTLKSEVTIHYNGNSITVPALWDTGANVSCVSSSVVSGLNLIATGMLPVSTPTGRDVVKTFLVDVTLPNNVNISGMRVCDSKIGDQGLGMLIGMDVINKGDFLVSNYQGKTVFSFRVPSESTMDFVSGIKASNVIMANRNKPKNFSKKKKR